MTDHSTAQPARKPRLSLDTWAVLAASLVILLIVSGLLPRIPW
jgi:hypothetical protein